MGPCTLYLADGSSRALRASFLSLAKLVLKRTQSITERCGSYSTESTSISFNVESAALYASIVRVAELISTGYEVCAAWSYVRHDSGRT